MTSLEMARNARSSTGDGQTALLAGVPPADYRFGSGVGTFVVTGSAPRVTVCVSAGFAGGIVGAAGGLLLPPPLVPEVAAIST